MEELLDRRHDEVLRGKYYETLQSAFSKVVGSGAINRRQLSYWLSDEEILLCSQISRQERREVVLFYQS